MIDQPFTLDDLRLPARDDSPLAMPITDVPRNDIEACRRYYESRGSRITPDEMSMLLQLQDRPGKLMKLSESWRVTGV